MFQSGVNKLMFMLIFKYYVRGNRQFVMYQVMKKATLKYLMNPWTVITDDSIKKSLGPTACVTG